MSDQLTILIVDDNLGHCELIRRNLRRAGLNNPTVTLNDGQSALDYLAFRGKYNSRAPTPVLVLLDIKMPGLDGVEVLRQIKSDPERKRTPVIMLTTTDDPREIEHCYSLGCNVYISKPVDASKFMEAINRLGLFISVVRLPDEDPK